MTGDFLCAGDTLGRFSLGRTDAGASLAAHLGTCSHMPWAVNRSLKPVVQHRHRGGGEVLPLLSVSARKSNSYEHQVPVFPKLLVQLVGVLTSLTKVS